MIKIVLAGSSGYGGVYLRFLWDHCQDYEIDIAGVVDPYVEKSPYYQTLQEKNIPLFNSMEDFYQTGKADLAIIASPIQFHASQTEIALMNGSNVLCEKPVCAGMEDIERMAGFKDKYKGFVEVGYQWSYAEAILDLKKDILAGVFGKAEYFKTLVSWPRSHAYFNRNNWAGKIKTQSGQTILDSVANNATAHYLHNMFFLSGKTMSEAVLPQIEDCVLGVANDIENFDTVTVRSKTNDGTVIYFAAAHPVAVNKGPVFELKFEKATVTYHAQEQQEIIAVFGDGSQRSYGDPSATDWRKLTMCLDKILHPENELPCNIETALPHAKFMVQLYQLYPVRRFKEDSIRIMEVRNAPVTVVDGLDETMQKSYECMSMLPGDRLGR
ncbi:MAG TPA: gfo/Idh/MocA family oxidoreductase [Clostridiales bacterium]|nr:gfo/Idh/MocA family oxidoreductase [Clostridiales bacterium]